MILRQPQALPATGRLLGLDYGERFWGLAISDSARTLATPRPPYQKQSWAQDKAMLANVIAEYNVSAIVLGLPLTLAGEHGKSASSTAGFAGTLSAELNIPVLLWDERLSTKQAENALFEQRQGRQTRGSKKAVKRASDSAAACLLLQSVLPLCKV